MHNGHQRYFCPECQQTFSESFDTLYYCRHVSPAQIQPVLQAHSEGSSLGGISQIKGLAYNEELVVTTEGKSDCKHWNSDEWGGYEPVLPPEILH